jgi:hypothetical protein
MGSGGMIVMDNTSSMVEVARYFMEFSMTESCGKCIPCRVGTVQMHGLLTRFSEKRATTADLALLELLCDLTKNTSLCGLGQSAPNPVLSTLRYFRAEYVEAMVDGDRLAEGAVSDGTLARAFIPLTVLTADRPSTSTTAAGGMPSIAEEGGRG